MKKDGVFQRFRDRCLTPWWSRYLLVPAIAALPAAVAAVWFGVHKDKLEPYCLKGQEPWVYFGASIWAGGMSAVKSALNDVSARAVSELVRDRESLLRLIGHVRMIVGFKSRRFHDALQKPNGPRTPESAFLEITHPDWQTNKIVQAIYSFFSAESRPSQERVAVSLMRWNDMASHLEFVEFFPDADHPRAAPQYFCDNSTVAGRAYFTNELVICENVETNPQFRALPNRECGSMFSYPVEDLADHKVIFIVNVISTKIGRFREAGRESILIPMEVFSDRLILEDRLYRIRRRVSEEG